MPIKQNKIYALVNNKKQQGTANIGSLAAIVDTYIYGNVVNQKILAKLESQDTLVVENVSALGKNVNEIVNALNVIAKYEINLCFSKENMSFKANELPEIASSLVLAFRLHQSLISLRSTTALQDRKAKGIKLGRPHNSKVALRLDEYKDDIKKMLQSGTSKDEIAKRLNVCRSTVYNFVRKNPELLGGLN